MERVHSLLAGRGVAAATGWQRGLRPPIASASVCRAVGSKEKGGGVAGQEMAEQFGKPVQAAKLAKDERSEREQGKGVQTTGNGYV